MFLQYPADRQVFLLVLNRYIWGGAVLFAKWEDWNMLDGSYFCFVSLSTIGFGDIVPGDKIYSGQGLELSFIFCSMYLMLGKRVISQSRYRVLTILRRIDLN